MNMNKFQQLIEELRTDLIIFVDDDFTPPNDSGEILSFIITLSDLNYFLLKNQLTIIDNDLLEHLDEFKESLVGIEFNEEHNDYIGAGLILEVLKNEKFAHLQTKAEAICQNINKNISDPENKFALTIMSYGLLKLSGALTCYKPFFESIRELGPQKIVRVYRSLEGNDFVLFYKEILDILQCLDNKSFLLIVDKMLANSQDGNVIISDLRARIDDTHTFFSVLFTSKESPLPTVPLSHFHFEIHKKADEEDSINRMSLGLALCAYAILFNKLSELNITALNEAKDLILKSGKENILYLASMAHSEGETVFDAITDWFGLLVQKKLNDKLFSQTDGTLDFNFIVRLTSFLNLDFFENKTENLAGDFKDAIQELSSFELFDYHINSSYSPPAPGDIFLIEEKLYVLTGQDCDLIVRDGKDGICRKDGLAEMIECEFSKRLLGSKKTESDSTIAFNYFFYNDNYGSLKAKFSERIFFDFRLLDLCSLNENGKSNYFADRSLSDNAIKSMPIMWSKYYPTLFNELQNKVDIYQALEKANISTDSLLVDKSFSLKPDLKDGIVAFPVERIARLKGKFKEYFLRCYWERKTRMGLNNISVFNRELVNIDTFKYGFSDSLQQTNVPSGWIQLSHNRDKPKSALPLILDKEEISLILPEPFKTKFQSISEEDIIINGIFNSVDTKITIKKIISDSKLGVEIIFPYFNEITTNNFKMKEAGQLGLKDIFPSNFIDELNIPPNAICYIADFQRDVFEDGRNPIKFSTEDLEKGIKIPVVNIGFKLNRETGVISEIPLLQDQ